MTKNQIVEQFNECNYLGYQNYI